MNADKFEELLSLEEALKGDSFAEVKNPISEGAETHKGTVDDPIPSPHIDYSDAVEKLMHAVYNFHKANPDYDLFNYTSILGSNGYTNIDIDSIDVSQMDDKSVLALFMAIVRGERFHDGLIWQALEEGVFQRGIARLRELISNC